MSTSRATTKGGDTTGADNPRHTIKYINHSKEKVACLGELLFLCTDLGTLSGANAVSKNFELPFGAKCGIMQLKSRRRTVCDSSYNDIWKTLLS